MDDQQYRRLSSGSRKLSDDLNELILKLRRHGSPRAVWMALAGEVLVEKMVASTADRPGLYAAIGDWQREVWEFLSDKVKGKT